MLLFGSGQLIQLMKSFRLTVWKLLTLTLEVLLLNGLAISTLAAVAVSPVANSLLIFVKVGLLMSGGLISRAAFIQTWLYATYRHHERRACLQFDPDTLTAAYTNTGLIVQFALTDIVSITQYECSLRHSARRYVIGRDYYYQVWRLRDDTELVLTSLLCSFVVPGKLLPLVQRDWVRPRICWLPGDPLLTWRGAAFFHF